MTKTATPRFRTMNHRFVLGLIALFFLFNGALNLTLVGNYKTELANDKQAIATLLLIEKLAQTLVEAEAAQRGFLISQDDSYLQYYRTAEAQWQPLISELKQAIDLDTYPLLAVAENKLKQRFESMQKTLTLAAVGREQLVAERIDQDSGIIITDEIAQHLAQLKDNYLAQISRSNENASQRLRVLTLVGVASTLLGLLLAVLFIRRLEQQRQREQALTLSLQEAKEYLEQRVLERTEALEQQRQALESSNQELENFAYVASHDLQEPLRKIRAFSDRLSTSYADVLDERGLDYFKRMRSASERMSTLIEDLLAVSRLTSTTLARDTVLLTDIAEDAAQALKEDIDDIGGTLTITPLPSIEGDASQLHRVFSNLLGNAYKYRSQTRPLAITVRDASNDIQPPQSLDDGNRHGFYAILVEDNGVGFDWQYAERIFAMFQRLHSRTDYKGTGIGLAICRKIIERHYGAILVHRAQENQGASFVIFLPKPAPTETPQDT